MARKLIVAAAVALLLLGAAPAVRSADEGGGAALVCLDPGHGGDDSGANYNGVMEKDPNLDIALRVRPILQSLGYRVIMTRTTDVTLSLEQRCQIANSAHADIFVSIHNNAYMTTSQGTETYSYYDSPEGKRLATCIHTEVVRRIQRPDRGVKEAGFYVLRNTDMTSALIEGAFVSNAEEAGLLQDPEFRQQIADGVAAGIYFYLIDPGRFDEFVLLTNPDPERAAEVEMHYMRGDGLEEVYPELVPPRTRRTVHLDEFVFNNDVATLVKSTNGVPVVAERAMYFDFAGGSGGHGSPGITAPAYEWYLAEGSTDWGFSTYVVVQNPADSETYVTIQFMRDDGFNAQETYELAPHSRFTLDCSTVEGVEEADFSVKVNAQSPVVVERAMYFTDYKGASGGHDSAGLTAPGTRWYMAEGYTGGDFDTYVTLQNPEGSAATARVTYILPDGAAISRDYRLAPQSRRTVHVDEVPGLENTDVSFLVESGSPVIAERSMYFDYNGIAEGTNSTAVLEPASRWYLAEGYTGPGFDTYVLLMNPGDADTEALLSFMLEDGSERTHRIEVPAHRRRTVKVNDVSGMSGVAFATTVESAGPLVVERAKYYSYGGKSGGDSALGVTQPSLEWYFAEGCTR